MKQLNLCLLLLLLPLIAIADPVEINGIYYNLNANEKQAEVTGNPSIPEYSGSYSGDVTIPAEVIYEEIEYSVTSIGKYAFFDCPDLTSVTIPKSVTSIGNDAFFYCPALTSMIIPNSVISIEYSAFYGCSGLTSVNIPNSVTSIGSQAFCNCSGLTSITITNSETSIGEYVFTGTGWYNNQSDGLLYLDKFLLGYKGSKPTGELNIAEGTRGIAAYAFSECSDLTSVNIPNSVKSIGEYAFFECWGLTSVNIPNSVTSIGDRAFHYCSSLTSMTIPNGVTSIGFSTFEGCSGLTSVTIPNSVTLIGPMAFCSCKGLTSITIPNSVINIGSYAFSGCSSLTSFTIGNSVTNIGVVAFSGCSGLKSVYITDIESWFKISFSSTDSNPLFYAHHLYLNGELMTSLVIPNSVTSIGDYAFLTCNDLTSVTIPNSVTSIGSSVFKYCTGLTDVYCIAEKVPSTNENAFKDSYPDHITLHVPAGSIEDYRATVPWCDFGNIVALTDEELDPSSIVLTNSDSSPYPIKYFNLDGKRISKPQRGLNIIKMSDGTTKKVIVKQNTML